LGFPPQPAGLVLYSIPNSNRLMKDSLLPN
jgi:hypothetical protein